ncbi:MAG: hypothetical protein WC934_06065 [Acidithiobacillus sp.]|jgi:hypothetical protein|uniref:hypothetical protein n=1 Tax=Acidithiobacillus sp. TaxID=1872118 RepID=UPI0035608F51
MSILDKIQQLICEIKDKDKMNETEIDLEGNSIEIGTVTNDIGDVRVDRFLIGLKNELYGINIVLSINNSEINTFIANLRQLQCKLNHTSDMIFGNDMVKEGIYIYNGMKNNNEIENKSITLQIVKPDIKLAVLVHLDKQQTQDLIDDLQIRMKGIH